MSLKASMNTREVWTEFCTTLDEKIAKLHRSLESLNDPIQIHKTQGQILALRNLKYLRDELNGRTATDGRNV